ncbi:fatty acid desaturase [Chitinophagaceae bacterium LWZ2-11]
MKLRHDHLKDIVWQDLSKLSLYEKIVENTLTVPWLLASWVLAYYHLYFLALPCSFMFFLTGLRQAHNGFHHTLGTSHLITQITLFINSILMLASMDAVKYNHLRHHKCCLEEGDEEGKCAKMKAGKALLYGPIFIFRLHKSGLLSKNKRTVINIITQLVLILIGAITVFVLNITFLKYHVIVMIAAELMTAFFAVWTVHHDCDEEVIARSISNTWKSRLTYSMFYHLEHHLYPQVPTIKLRKLSERIKTQHPEIKIKEVF